MTSSFAEISTAYTHYDIETRMLKHRYELANEADSYDSWMFTKTRADKITTTCFYVARRITMSSPDSRENGLILMSVLALAASRIDHRYLEGIVSKPSIHHLETLLGLVLWGNMSCALFDIHTKNGKKKRNNTSVACIQVSCTISDSIWKVK